MVNNNNTYNQEQMQQLPMPPVPPRMGRVMAVRRPKTWRERMMHRFGMDTAVQMPTKGANTIPNWITGRPMVFFFIAMFACWAVFGYVPAIDLWLAASISVVLFFYGGGTMARNWEHVSEKRFLRNVFITGFVVRLLWALYCFFIFNPEYFGNTFGDLADTGWYMDFAKDLAVWLTGDSQYTLSQIIEMNCSAIDDVGYPMWLAVGYVFWGEWSDVFMPFVVKCIVGAYCAICIYRVAKRHFGDGIARMAAIFVALNPNMVYWCATMMKEAEMVFFCCVAIDNFDRVLSSGKRFTFRNLLPGMLAALALMFFRTALGLVVFLAFFAHVVMASNRIMSMGKKVLAGVLVGTVLVVAMGDRIRTQSQALLEAAQSNRQQANMEWRAEREGGNSFAKYAGTAVFAPLIFTIPFPTFNQANAAQLLQVQTSGGCFIKNIFSFFVILVFLMMLISSEWRQHVFILAYTLGYHVVLAMSPFAHSGRFHMPVWPMMMLFAAYGIQIAKTNKKVRGWFPLVLVVEVVICLAWNWFKLKGRGLI